MSVCESVTVALSFRVYAFAKLSDSTNYMLVDR